MSAHLGHVLHLEVEVQRARHLGALQSSLVDHGCFPLQRQCGLGIDRLHAQAQGANPPHSAGNYSDVGGREVLVHPSASSADVWWSLAVRPAVQLRSTEAPAAWITHTERHLVDLGWGSNAM